LLADRAVGVAAKKPTANPVVAPTAVPTRNFVDPSLNSQALPLAHVA
jgi:hypothetical protein